MTCMRRSAASGSVGRNRVGARCGSARSCSCLIEFVEDEHAPEQLGIVDHDWCRQVRAARAALPLRFHTRQAHCHGASSDDRQCLQAQKKHWAGRATHGGCLGPDQTPCSRQMPPWRFRAPCRLLWMWEQVPSSGHGHAGCSVQFRASDERPSASLMPLITDEYTYTRF
jgi:hypothetical protein